jgi:hypothetical protein
MKKSLITICSAAMLFAACNNAGDTAKTSTEDTAAMAPATEPAKDEAFVPVDSATAMKAWMAASTPGDMHKALAKSDGKWMGESTLWGAAGAPPSTSTAEMNNKMILGGRFQMGEFKGNMMGMPFEGISVVGYDNTKKKFVSSWVDNTGTGIMTMEGTWDDATKAMTMTGSMMDPATHKNCDMKEVFTMVDDDHQTMEMWGPDPKTGKQFKSLEIKFTRKK